eukprot:JP446637.1.p1 GENE.JP446637.1~~JP446637.1.p1  ORF type:complete len:268 (+),score=79.81 JP446637.1:30-833(+)
MSDDNQAPAAPEPTEPSLGLAVAAEFIGVFLFVFCGCSAAISTTTGILPVAFAFGLAIMIGVYATGNVSGGHLNPAVSLAFLVTGVDPKFSPKKFLCYILAQFTGGILGALLLKAVTPVSMHPLGVHGTLGATNLGKDVTPLMAIGIEIISTFALVFIVFATAVDEKQGAGNSAPMAIGFAVVLGILGTGRISGGSMNPARSLGPSVAGGYWSYQYVYFIGPFLGAIFASLLYKYAFLSRHEKAQSAEYRPLVNDEEAGSNYGSQQQ